MSWKMMLRVKTGEVKFLITHPASKKTWHIDPAETLPILHARWLAISPDMIWQYAQRLKKEFAEQGYSNVEVYAIGSVSLNGRTAKALVNPEVDLASVKWHPFRHSDWIMEPPR